MYVYVPPLYIHILYVGVMHYVNTYVCVYRYCMPWPRHVMQSLEIQSVTQARVSDDYTPGNQQWKIGDTTILATALGLASFKDVSQC